MLTADRNERLTRVGRGTPAGNLLRRYWHPVSASSELPPFRAKRVRLLGEDLVLYRDGSGTLGLLSEHCPHRSASLVNGIPEERGLRCAYHGWLFDERGSCLDQPNETSSTNFVNRAQAPAYPAQELSGLIFAYLGPEPVPLLPRYDLLVSDAAYRNIAETVIPCNWLQIMENSVDPRHVHWLHQRYGDYLKRTGIGQTEIGAWASQVLEETLEDVIGSRHEVAHQGPSVEIGFDLFEYGIIKRRVVEGGSRLDEGWAVGHPLVFPTMLKVGGEGIADMQFRVPIDDENTWHVWYTVMNPPNVPPNAICEVADTPIFHVPVFGDDGEHIVDFLPGQDIMAWVTQGRISDRTQEHLGESDKGVALLRKLLHEQIALVEQGTDPMGVIRDPAANDMIHLPLEKGEYRDAKFWYGELRGKTHRYDPNFKRIVDMWVQATHEFERTHGHG